MNILVTGATGFLGTALVKQLNTGNANLRLLCERAPIPSPSSRKIDVCIGDIRHKETLEKALRGIDVVFHTASIYDSSPVVNKYPHAMYDINVNGTRNVLDAALKEKVKRVIYTSSAGTVGKNLSGSLSNENDLINVLEKRSHYEKSKAEAEKLALSYHSRGLNIISINPSFIFGPGDYRPTPTGEMVVKFLNRVYPCYFDASACLVDLDTAVEAHVNALTLGNSGERYIVAHPEPYLLKDVFSLLEDISGIPAPTLKLPLSALYAGSVVNECALSLLGLSKRFRPLIASELVRYFSLGAAYDSRKAYKDLQLTPRALRPALEEAVHWYMRNKYVKKAYRAKYYRKIGRLKRRRVESDS